jgi:hypothetical protein
MVEVFVPAQRPRVIMTGLTTMSTDNGFAVLLCSQKIYGSKLIFAVILNDNGGPTKPDFFCLPTRHAAHSKPSRCCFVSLWKETEVHRLQRLAKNASGL